MREGVQITQLSSKQNQHESARPTNTARAPKHGFNQFSGHSINRPQNLA